MEESQSEKKPTQCLESNQYEKEDRSSLGMLNRNKESLISGPIPSSAWFIIATELCERFAFYGASLLFIPYITTELSRSSASATAINRTFQFFAYFTTIVGALIADLYIGKFKTILLFSVVYAVGLALLSVSSIPASIESGFSFTGFCIAIFLFIAWGTGGIKSNVSAFAAQQVPDYQVSKKDPTIVFNYNITVERIFRYFYWAINLGALLGQILCPMLYHKPDSIPWAFGLPAIVFCLGILIFVCGRVKYTEKRIEGNPMLKVSKCIIYAIKNKNNEGCDHWLDRAKGENLPWNNNFVDELKRTVKACRVFVFYIFYWALYNNMSDAFIIQGLRMKKPSWLPGAEQLNLINSLVLVVCIPLFDFLLFPLLRKAGLKLGPISRITIGFVICSLCFVYATVLQKFIYQTGPYYDFTTDIPAKDLRFNDISIWYQIFPYSMIAISEIFASATGLEYAFKFATPELKSVVLSLFLLTNCGGSLIGLVLAIWSYDPNYLTLFAVQSAVMFLMAVLFYYLFRKQDDEV